MHHIRHKMAKIEGSSYFTLKATSFFWKVPTKIFVNPGQWSLYIRKTETDITSSKINIFNKIWTASVFWHWKLMKKRKILKNSRFFSISRFFQKNYIFGNFGTKFQIGTHNIKLMFYGFTKYFDLATLYKKMKASWRFSVFRYWGFSFT